MGEAVGRAVGEGVVREGDLFEWNYVLETLGLAGAPSECLDGGDPLRRFACHGACTPLHKSGRLGVAAPLHRSGRLVCALRGTGLTVLVRELYKKRDMEDVGLYEDRDVKKSRWGGGRLCPEMARDVSETHPEGFRGRGGGACE